MVYLQFCLDLGMAPTKLPPRNLGIVVPNRRRFRAQVKLNGITEAGPLRTREADAGADLALVRACQTSEEIPALLARLRAEAGMAPTKLSPRKLGTFASNRNCFRVCPMVQCFVRLPTS